MKVSSNHRLPHKLKILLALICLHGSLSASQIDPAIELQYRQDREAWMRSEQSPLALAGLFWLRPGSNRFGADSSNDIVLPVGSAPGKVGQIIVSGMQVQMDIENPEARMFLGEKRIEHRLVKTDAGGATPDELVMGELHFRIIQRGERLGLRLVHLKNPDFLRFKGLDFFPIVAAYRVKGEIVPYSPYKKIKITSVTGQVEEADCPGIVHFKLEGKLLSLEPILESGNSKELFFIFKDTTNGKETYEGGRFLYADLPQGGHVILNFNRAHNPYCAYSPFSTCLLPPPQNWLKVPILAGEKKYTLH